LEDQTLSAQTPAAPAAQKTDAAPAAEKSASDMAASDATLALILTSLEAEKAEDIVQIDLRGKTSMADHMVVCSGRSTRQVTALSDKLAEILKAEIGRSCKIEGKGQGDWVLLDAGDVIVHVFRPEVREFYQLEKMWQVTPSDAASQLSAQTTAGAARP
jgi:ribosome-associated protein